MNPIGGTALVVILISFIYLGIHIVLPKLGHDVEIPGISDATEVVADNTETDGSDTKMPGTEMLDDAIQALKKSENKVADDMPEEEYISLLSNSLTERLQNLGLTRTGACKIKMMVNRNGTPYAVTPSGCVGQDGFDDEVKRALMDIDSLPPAPLPLYEKYKELRFKVVGKG